MAGQRDKFVAYKVTHRESDKSYVGITTRTLAARWAAHGSPSRKNCGAIGAAIRKYGRDAFEVIFLAARIGHKHSDETRAKIKAAWTAWRERRSSQISLSM